MNPRKLMIIVGILLVLAIVFLVLNRIFDDDTQPVFNEALTAQATVIELSDLALQRGSAPDTRADATAIFSTTNSDYNQLALAYESEFGDSHDMVDEQVIEEMAETSENFDPLYREYVTEHLELSVTYLRDLEQRISDEQTQAIVQRALENQENHIRRLD